MTCGHSSKTWLDWAKPMWFLDSAHQIHPQSAKKTQTTNLFLTSVISILSLFVLNKGVSLGYCKLRSWNWKFYVLTHNPGF